jgi:acetyl-CoA carboxylase, biotin carboxylase subunit
LFFGKSNVRIRIKPRACMPTHFKKILIANRGEIALRVIRACREMGITPVAVYSEMDRAALHVRKADEAYAIGPAAAAESYLNIGRILDAARRSGVDAIHPGYGFLSENEEFAQACADVGVKFIGPSPQSMRQMGSKTAARQAMERAQVPIVPGTAKAVVSSGEAAEIAKKLGYPVMLKAAAGGGGKGMRLVHGVGELATALEAAQSEALRAFGDSSVYLEKAIVGPRHIEVQVLADEQGHTIYLGERECSIQRRHQKVLEESPSPLVDAAMSRRMGEAAVQVARTAGYANAGTVEFLVDAGKNFYFLEMNTRLQVEHPVTEFVTGLDLVHWQIRIAQGEALSLRQADIQVRGHAIECRIYAEDPENNYFPSPGLITYWQEPAGPGIRVDSGVYEGWRVPMEYDPLLAKLIGFGSDRKQAIERLRRAVAEYAIGGIKTNLALFSRILRDPAFLAGDLSTAYLDGLAKSPEKAVNVETAAIAAALFTAMDKDGAAGGGSSSRIGTVHQDNAESSVWKRAARGEALR